jgi:hypothetical protein
MVARSTCLQIHPCPERKAMNSPTDHLHDATLVGLHYSNNVSQDAKMLVMDVVYSPEAGDPALDGQPASIVAMDVRWMRHIACGYVSGEEEIDDWGTSLSMDAAHELQKMEAAGLSLPKNQVRVTFRSGSVLEIACRELSVVVKKE